MTVALGLMEYLLNHEQRNNFLFLFQPAEERPGGAKIMFDEVIEPKYHVDEFYALHDTPEYKPEIISTKTGALFAGGEGYLLNL
jgi:N-acetyldiaminopimelate deacetylase